MEAQGSFLPSGAGASSCGNKTWRERREVAVSRSIGLVLNPGLPVMRGLQNRWQQVGREGWEKRKKTARVPSAQAQVEAQHLRALGLRQKGESQPCRKPWSRTFTLDLWANTY